MNKNNENKEEKLNNEKSLDTVQTYERISFISYIIFNNKYIAFNAKSTKPIF